MGNGDWWLSAALPLVLMWVVLLGSASGQAGADMDMTSEQDTDASNDMDQTNLVDPSITNPSNKQGYGRDVPDGTNFVPNKGKGGQTTSKPSVVEKDLGEQTVQAALQFGVLVAVALMVGLLFMLNIWAELCFDAIVEKICDCVGTKPEPDIEEQDPAALVGTFKRYK